jgi:hypothetical protein
MPRKRSPERILSLLLRQAVLEHAASERRRHHVPILHIGLPGEPHEVFAVVPSEPTDHALRADIVAAMRQRELQRQTRHSVERGTATALAPTLVWLTRSGVLEVQDLDVDWHAAARQAYAEADADLAFAVVTRRGWHDPQTGARREWTRPRPSS